MPSDPQLVLAPAPLEHGARSGIDRAEARNVDRIARLVPLMRELAQRAGDAGVTVADLRVIATQRYLIGPSKGRRFSWLAAVPRRAGLVPTRQMRRSHIPGAHGNLQRVWRLP